MKWSGLQTEDLYCVALIHKSVSLLQFNLIEKLGILYCLGNQINKRFERKTFTIIKKR